MLTTNYLGPISEEPFVVCKRTLDCELKNILKIVGSDLLHIGLVSVGTLGVLVSVSAVLDY